MRDNDNLQTHLATCTQKYTEYTSRQLFITSQYKYVLYLLYKYLSCYLCTHCFFFIKSFI